jgi:hypothetical protein
MHSHQPCFTFFKGRVINFIFSKLKSSTREKLLTWIQNLDVPATTEQLLHRQRERATSRGIVDWEGTSTLPL